MASRRTRRNPTIRAGAAGQQIAAVRPAVGRAPEAIEEKDRGEPDEEQESISRRHAPIGRDGDAAERHEKRELGQELRAVADEARREVRENEVSIHVRVPVAERIAERRPVPEPVERGKGRSSGAEPREGVEPPGKGQGERDQHQGIARTDEDRHTEARAGGGRPSGAASGAQGRHHRRRRPERRGHVAHRLKRVEKEDDPSAENRGSGEGERPRQAELPAEQERRAQTEKPRDRADEVRRLAPAADRGGQRQVQRKPRRIERHHRARTRPRLVGERREDGRPFRVEAELLQAGDRVHHLPGQNVLPRVRIPGRVRSADGSRRADEQEGPERQQDGRRYQREEPGARPIGHGRGSCIPAEKEKLRNES